MYIFFALLWFIFLILFIYSRSVAMKERVVIVIKYTFLLYTAFVLTAPFAVYAIRLNIEPFLLKFDSKKVKSIEIRKPHKQDEYYEKIMTSEEGITAFSKMLSDAHEIRTVAKSSAINNYYVYINFNNNKTLFLSIKESVEFGTFIRSRAKESSFLKSYYRNDSLKIFLDSLFKEPPKPK